MRRPAAALVAALLALGAGCGSDAPDDAGATTSTTGPGSTTTEPDPTSTTADPACPAVAVPTDAEELWEAIGDVDGDGDADALRSFRSGSAWFLQVDLAVGGGAEVEVPSFGDLVGVLGSGDVDGDGAEEVWARTGAGASATILGLARLEGCQLQLVTFATGGPAELPVGGSVGATAGAQCDAEQLDAHLTAYSALHADEGSYEVTAVEYELEGSVLTERHRSTATVDAFDEAFARATTFTCGDLTL